MTLGTRAWESADIRNGVPSQRGFPGKLSHGEFGSLGTFRARWDNHKVWLHLIRPLYHWLIWEFSMASGVKAGGARPHIQSFCLEIKPKPQKVLGQAERGCGEAESPAVSLL